MDKVSVITVCYNAQDVIESTIESVLSQDYENMEYILVDGASNDNTLDILEKYRVKAWEYSKKVWKQVSEPDLGIYDAMNKGVKLSTGKWVIFMNAGDCFAKRTTVSEMLLDKHKEYDGVFGDTIRVKGSKRLYVKGRNLENIKTDIPLPFCHQSVFMKRDLLIEHPYSLKYKQAGDYNLFCELYILGCKFFYMSIPVSLYLMGGISEVNNIQQLAEKMEIRENYGLEHYSRIKKFYMISWLKIKRFVKRLIPGEILDKIQKFE